MYQMTIPKSVCEASHPLTHNLNECLEKVFPRGEVRWETGGSLTHTGVRVVLARNKTAAYFLSGFGIALSWLKDARPGSFLKI